MTMDRHDVVAGRLEEYVLGQLDPDMQRGVESHVRECDVCAAEIRELMAVMEAIGSTPDATAPPARLKARVLSTLAAQAPAQMHDIASPRRLDRRQRWQRGALAAAAVAVLGLTALLYRATAARDRAEADVERATADMRRAEALVADLQERLADYAGQTDRALAILTSADMREIPLAGTRAAAATAARAYWSPTRGLLVVADRLPVPPPGRIYQVWVIGAGQPVSAGLLGTQTAGRGMLIAPPPGALAPGAVTVAVTDEPPGGLAAPTGAMHLVGSL